VFTAHLDKFFDVTEVEIERQGHYQVVIACTLSGVCWGRPITTAISRS